MMTAVLPLLCGCGDDDNDSDPIVEPTATGPKVVSTLPADGATDISIGIVNVQVVYDKDIRRSSDISLQPTVAGGTLTGSATVSGNSLNFSVVCPEYETTVVVSIPKI